MTNPTLTSTSLARPLWSALLLLWLPLTVRADQDAARVYKQSRESVVLIEGKHRVGSGVVIPGVCPVATNCDVWFVITNYHVISGESSITAKFASGAQVRIDEVVASDRESDLAILRMNGGPFAYSELGDSESLAVGQHIIVISNPMGLQGSVTEGLVSAVREIHGRVLLQISAPVSPGSSGGPVFDQHGRVVGIVKATIEGAQNVNLAIPSLKIRSLLRYPHASKLADLSPESRAGDDDEGLQTILRRVSTYLDHEMIEEAEGQLRAGVKEYEFDPVLRLELAKILIRTGRSEEGLQQLRVATRLAPDDWRPVALTGHLYLKRWLKDGNISDRRVAYQTYRKLLDIRGVPVIKQQLVGDILEQMKRPDGEWITSDGQHTYIVTAKQDGGFFVTLPREQFDQAMSSWAQSSQSVVSYLAFAPYDAEFHAAEQSGKFTGSSSYIDATCGYKQSLEIEVSDDGTSMDMNGTITQVTGPLKYLTDVMGKKRIEKMCQKPGAEGLRLRLNRLLTRDGFVQLDVMLDTDTRPLAQR